MAGTIFCDFFDNFLGTSSGEAQNHQKTIFDHALWGDPKTIRRASGPRRDRSREEWLSDWSVSCFSALSLWSVRLLLLFPFGLWFLEFIGRENGGRPLGVRS